MLKLINDETGEIIEIFDEMDAIFAFRAKGDMMLLIPNDEERAKYGIGPEDDLPLNVVTMGAVAAMLTTEDGRQIIAEWFEANRDKDIFH